ncbi:unnamed protein product, partial [Trypanosoma congolense IL3000]
MHINHFPSQSPASGVPRREQPTQLLYESAHRAARRAAVPRGGHLHQHQRHGRYAALLCRQPAPALHEKEALHQRELRLLRPVEPTRLDFQRCVKGGKVVERGRHAAPAPSAAEHARAGARGLTFPWEILQVPSQFILNVDQREDPYPCYGLPRWGRPY